MITRNDNINSISDKLLKSKNTKPNGNSLKLSTSTKSYSKRKLISLNEKTKKPRWWTQNYLLFLAMRTSDKPLTRKELIPRALALDKKIAKERNLPTLFHGKTPQNTASGRLTTNFDKTFISFIPEGQRKIHFKLAYEPGCFKSAFEKYKEWSKNLIEKDWPYFFKEQFVDYLETDLEINIATQSVQSVVNEHCTKEFNTTKNHFDIEVDSVIKLNNSKSTIPNGDPAKLNENRKLNQTLDFCKKDQKISIEKKPQKLLKKFDYKIPSSLDELLEKRISTIPNAGNGLFTRMPIPKHTFLGFYFGVPMTEDEFDGIKSQKGVASSYCFRYRNTVLDPTDNDGVLYDINCPFFFINEGKVNVQFLEGRFVNQIICCTTRDIDQGEELFVDYGVDVLRPWLQ